MLHRLGGKTGECISTNEAILCAEVERLETIVNNKWSKNVPNESGYWGDDGVRYFATQGQHGWNRFQWVEDMGGFWMMLSEPPLPE